MSNDRGDMKKGLLIFACLLAFMGFSIVWMLGQSKPYAPKPQPVYVEQPYKVPPLEIVKVDAAPKAEPAYDPWSSNTNEEPSYGGSKYSDSGGGSSHRSSHRAPDGAPKDVYVHGYTRKNGTYVSPHSRRSPKR